MKKKLAAIAAAAMCVAMGSNTALASVFADINDVPWPEAAQYIDEAASLGLMAGYTENGQKVCKAKNNVTYCEAVQLMYSIMCSNNSSNKASGAVITKWTPSMQSANLPQWAYESTAYALENSVLNLNDIKIFVNKSGAQNNARREDVAVIFGKALSKLYSVNQGATISYKDASSVAASSVPYLEMLSRLGLMVGDADNNFNPKANINRAEMAVLSTKTLNELKKNPGQTNPNQGTNQGGKPSTSVNNEQLVGTVTEVSDDSITIQTSSGEKTVKVSSSAAITYNGEKGEIGDINENDSAVVVVNNGTATFINAYPVYGSSKNDSITKGTITSLSKTRITIEKDSKKSTYKFDEDYNEVKLTLDKKTDKDIDDLIDLVKDGANIEADITADRKGYVTKITAVTSDSSATEGIITGLTSKKITIKSGSTTNAYSLPEDTDDIKVTLDGKSSDFDKLKDKYDDKDDDINVKLTLGSKKVVSKIEASTEESSSATSGTITSVTSSKIKIKTSSGGSKSYDIDSNCKVTIDGSSSSVSRLVSKAKDETYDVKLTVSGSKATKIVASAKDDAADRSGQIRSIDDDEIKIKDSNGKNQTYEFASSCKFTLDGKTTTLEKLIDKYEDGGGSKVRAYITLNSSDKATKVAVDTDAEEVNEKEGEIKDLDDDEIKIKLSDGSTKTYDLASSCKVTIDGSTSTVSKLEKKIDNDETYQAELTLDSSKRVTRIKASSSKGSVSGNIMSIDEDKIKLGERNKNNVYIGTSYPLSKSVKVYVDGDKIDLDKFISMANSVGSYTADLDRNSDGEVTKITAKKK